MRARALSTSCSSCLSQGVWAAGLRSFHCRASSSLGNIPVQVCPWCSCLVSCRERRVGVWFGLMSICTVWDWPREEQTGWINLPCCPVITGPRIP